MAARLLLRSALRAATVSRACPALAHTRGMAAGGKTGTAYMEYKLFGGPNLTRLAVVVAVLGQARTCLAID
jgi:hypothetical protein